MHNVQQALWRPCKIKKICQKFQLIFFWRLSVCACCPNVHHFFFMLSNDVKVLRNQICCTHDNFFTFKIFHFDLPPKFGKKKMLIFTNTFVAQQFFNKCCPKFFREFFINISISKIFFITVVPSQKKIKSLENLAEIKSWYDCDL